jgi:hypothetical protein
MNLTRDMNDLLDIFDKNDVKYMIIGGFAVICYGYVRITQDIDFLVYPSKVNAKKMMKSLTEFGFGNAGIPLKCFEQEGTAVHIGVEPNRIDFLTCVQGASNDLLFEDIHQVDYAGRILKIISKDNLIKVKKATGRLKDLADAEELEKIKN